MNFEDSADIEEGCQVSVSGPLADGDLLELLYDAETDEVGCSIRPPLAPHRLSLLVALVGET